MTNSYFFGYGSLVNRRTHIYTPAFPAQATGWRRAWRCTSAREPAFLTVVPDPGCMIEGLVAVVPGQDWAALDLREANYDRLAASHCVSHPLDTTSEIAIYAIPEDSHRLPDASHPVLLSYLDVVLQGYLLEFGRAGADRFLATTTGWEAPIRDDRARPRYPRAQELTASERLYVDQALQSLGCKVLV
ncbi:gamma-glutamylcyclotransferase family protein [Puniceibacterium confluentis]|uniref:gamma-glutamylcyclotransferase family protein n=1 Tax=Puniceibacterium confluentis TaxID=1958944 RepID=UPI0011B4D151|nr:gamma-glutamylcyclotransferase family protein [Puniceibacterium confluentis]